MRLFFFARSILKFMQKMQRIDEYEYREYGFRDYAFRDYAFRDYETRKSWPYNASYR